MTTQTKEQMISEIEAWSSALPVGYQATDANVALIVQDIQTNEAGVYNRDSLNRATQRVSKDYRWTWAAQLAPKSEAEIECNKIVAENFNQGQIDEFNHWFKSQKLLENEGDNAWENAATLLRELIGRPITPENIERAIGRVGAPSSKYHTASRPLHYVPVAAKTGPRGRHGHMPELKTGEFLSSSDVNKSPLQYKAEMEAAQAANNPTQTQAEVLSAADAQWKSLAQKEFDMGRPTHSFQAQVQESFNNAVKEGKSWRKIFEATKETADALQRRRTQGGSR